MKSKPGNRWQFVSGVVFALGWLAASAAAEPVAMVTDLEGKAALVAEGKKRALSILSEIESDARIEIEGGGRVVAVYLKSGDEYEARGPAVLHFRAAQPEALAGAKPQKRGTALAKAGKDIRIKPVGVAQAALVMRSAKPGAKLKLLNLSGTKTLDLHPEFRWQPLQAGSQYRFELTDDTGKMLLETQVDGTSLRLPASIELKDGVHYTWAVAARLPDGKKYSSAGDFSLAPADLRARVEALRPGDGAPVSQRVAFAAWLDQMELRDEAIRYWKTIAKERPDDSRLRALAGE